MDRYQFAKDAVTATQFDYTKASRANWGRGAVGATLFTFRTFMLSYIGFLSNLPPRSGRWRLRCCSCSLACRGCQRG